MDKEKKKKKKQKKKKKEKKEKMWEIGVRSVKIEDCGTKS
jgi:hypothetical protein